MFLRICFTLVLLVGSFASFAQDVPIPLKRPNSKATESLASPNNGDAEIEDIFPDEDAELTLSARLSHEDALLDAPVIWRIFSKDTNELVEKQTGSQARVTLPSGIYTVSASFGYATRMQDIKLFPPITADTILFQVGGLRLGAEFGSDKLIPSEDIVFRISQADELTGKIRVLVREAPANVVLQLNSGTYQIESRYGDINSIARADVEVQAGQITDMVLLQRGAKITLKLVAEAGGEALADTTWSVSTTQGQVILKEIASPFPTLRLSEGEYEVIAHHEGQIHVRSFLVESGVHGDVEVIMSE